MQGFTPGMPLQGPMPRGRGEVAETFRDPMEDYRQQMQTKLPFQQENPRGPARGGDQGGMQDGMMSDSMKAYNAAAEREQRERVAVAARSLESRFRTEVELCERKLQQQMMMMAGGVAVLLVLVYWRASRQ